MAVPGPGQLGGPGLPGKVRIADAKLTSSAVMEQDRFGRFISDIERSGSQLLEELADKMESRARRYAPSRTGRLKRSIRSVVLSNGREARVYTDVPYAGVMERGSKPHLIHGVRANFDWKGGRFVWNDPRYGPIGEQFDPYAPTSRESSLRGHHRRQQRKSSYQNWTYAYGATVRHPGTRAQRFMGRAFQETWAEARFVMRKVYSR